MKRNLTRKLIDDHLVEGKTIPEEEIAIRIEQTLTQDSTGTMVMLELEAMGVERARTDLSAQYVDHGLVQEDFKNADDHLFLRSACRRFGLWYSPPGNGVSHPVHMERFGIPGKTMLGSDSHTCAAGSLGMLAIGAGGLDVAQAIAGEPFHVRMPLVWGIKLVGKLPDWVSAKDVILELLRRHDVSGGVGRIIEYYGPGLRGLSAMDRHVIANMGMELGATTSVFPADDAVRAFLKSQGREKDWRELKVDDGADYDVHEEIDLSRLEPLIAMPSSPGNVCPVREVAGAPIYQAYIGSSANPGYRDFAVAARMVAGRHIKDHVSFDVNPTSRQILANLTEDGRLLDLIKAGARIHQAGCNGCIGMGQAPATDRISLRTVPRNFPGRSGTREDKVCLVSPETAAASALSGVITDPRTFEMPYPKAHDPEQPIRVDGVVPPLAPAEARKVKLERGPNIAKLPEFDPFPNEIEIPILLKMGDNISTDTIAPAGTRALPFRSNIPELSRFCFEPVDEEYHQHAKELQADGGHALAAGKNYGQGSSREHAALAPRFLGLRLVLAKSFARIHRQNLVNAGVLPLKFTNEADYENLRQGDKLKVTDVHRQLRDGRRVRVEIGGKALELEHDLSSRELAILLAGGVINWLRQKLPRQNAESKEYGAPNTKRPHPATIGVK